LITDFGERSQGVLCQTKVCSPLSLKMNDISCFIKFCSCILNTLTKEQNKLDCLSLASLSSLE
jgi:hypothetical protein